MHLLTRYGLSTGVKIGKPFILNKFFPIADFQYITFHPFSKYQSKCYDYWQDVLDIIFPYLNKKNIKIIQIGAKGEQLLRGIYNTVGQTSIPQCSYIISHALLHLGADSFATHIASGSNKKIVAIYSNNFANAVRPYWTKNEDCVLIEPDRKESKPSFSAEEHPKSINSIKPEDIAKGVLKLLEIELDYPYLTFNFGANYHNKFIENIPNQVINPSGFGIDSIVIRMDFYFDETCLEEQLKISKCCIVTNIPINE